VKIQQKQGVIVIKIRSSKEFLEKVGKKGQGTLQEIIKNGSLFSRDAILLLKKFDKEK